MNQNEKREIFIYTSFKVLIISFFLATFISNALGQKIFPGAEGFGTESRGAYSGSSSPKILIVDNLEPGSIKTSENSGSFQWCVSQKFPRIVLFKVSGVIDYTKYSGEILVDYPYMSVYGQTSPDNGITLLGAHILVRSNDLLVQHIKFRNSEYEPREQTNSIVIAGSRVVIDHCSFSFSNDEIITIWNADQDITISNCIAALPLHYSKHITGEATPEGHGFGIIDKAGKNVSYIRNLIAYTVDRNPLTNNYNCIFLNNFAYSYTGYGPKLENLLPCNYAIIGNINLPTESQKDISWKRHTAMLTGDLNSGASVWLHDNVSQAILDNPNTSQWESLFNKAGCIEPKKNPIDMRGFTILPVDSVESHVTRYSGAFYWNRDYIDQLVVDSVKARRMEYINSPEDLPARAYNISAMDGLRTNAGNMRYGYDFSIKSINFTVNGKSISLKQKYTTQQQVIDALNQQLPKGTFAYDHPADRCYHIIIRTQAKGAGSKLSIGGDASVFGIANGDYFGSNGIGGYPKFGKIVQDLTLPDNPHEVAANGYTELENWVASQKFIPQKELVVKSTVKLFPNPNNGNFKVLLENSFLLGSPIKININNLNGNSLYFKEENYFSEMSMNLSDLLPKGIFVLSIYLGNNYYLSKVFIKN